jgi:hypothetical protein
MSTSASGDELLRALRRAAERRDRNGCWSATQKLLRRLSENSALTLSRDFLARRLPLFERHQPGVHWPREFIESVSETGMAQGDRLWPEEEDDFPGPGANTFTSAVEALWKASRFRADAQRRNELLADALVGAVNAERLEHWGSRHPETWALWYQLASTGLNDPRIVEIQLTIMKDPEAVRIENEAWLEAIQLFEDRLKAPDMLPGADS